MITALDTKNGHKRWSTPTKGGIIATPLVVDNTVYVASTDHFLYALESQTGHVRWKHDCGVALFSTPAIGDGVVCIGGDHKIIGLDSETGTEKWSYLTGGLFHNRAVFAADHFYLNGSDNTLYALSSNGKLKWKQTVGTKNYGDERFGPIYSPADDSPTYLNGRIYINTNDNALLALRSDTGELVWKSGYPFADGFIKGFSSPIAQDGVIFVHEREGSPNVFAIEPSTGELRWTANTHVQLNSNIIDLSGDHLTVCSTTGQISWIDRKSGKLLYQYWLDPGSVFSAPVSSGKVTYAASMNGMVYAIAIP